MPSIVWAAENISLFGSICLFWTAISAIEVYSAWFVGLVFCASSDSADILQLSGVYLKDT